MSAKKLEELLKDQQEPFTLELYLLERGYSKNKLDSQQSFLCFSTNSSKFLKRSASSGIERGRNFFPICSKLVRAVFNKLVSINSRIKSHKSRDQENEEEEEEDRFSSASSTTVYNSCSENDTEEVGRERDFKCGCNENKKQLSPVSVLEEIRSDEPSPLHNRKEAASTISNTIKTKKINMALLQTKQLLCDCVREAVETQTRKYATRREQRFLGAEEIGKILCENIWEWSEKSKDGKNVINLGQLASAEEWNDFEQQKKEIGMVIGDLILEDLSNGIVIEMVCN